MTINKLKPQRQKTPPASTSPLPAPAPTTTPRPPPVRPLAALLLLLPLPLPLPLLVVLLLLALLPPRLAPLALPSPGVAIPERVEPRHLGRASTPLVSPVRGDGGVPRERELLRHVDAGRVRARGEGNRAQPVSRAAMGLNAS